MAFMLILAQEILLILSAYHFEPPSLCLVDEDATGLSNAVAMEGVAALGKTAGKIRGLVRANLNFPDCTQLTTAS